MISDVCHSKRQGHTFKRTAAAVCIILLLSGIALAETGITWDYFLFNLTKNTWYSDKPFFTNAESVELCKNSPRTVYAKKTKSWDIYSTLFYGNNYSEKLEKNLTEGWNASETQSALSKDCEDIAFVSTKDGTKDIWLMSFDGDYQENLIADTEEDRDNCKECNDDVNPDFSRDGKTIFFSRCVPVVPPQEPGHVKAPLLSEKRCQYDLMALDIKTKKMMPLLGKEWQGSDELDIDTFYESDTLVFSSNRFGVWQIFTADYNGAKVKQLTTLEKDAIYPKVSFDDRYIVFNVVDYLKKESEFEKPKEWYRALVMETSGGNIKDIVSDPVQRLKPFWLPSTSAGDYIVALRREK